MTRHEPELQDLERGITAWADTKHGYGLWRGHLVHPGFGTVSDEGVPTGTRMEEIVASGDPITDAKGLGIRLSWRAPKGVVPHFFVSDRDFQQKISASYPAFHHASVRLLADYIRSRGYAGLRQVVQKNQLPKNPFVVGHVQTEKTFTVDDVVYRPDIVVENAEPNFPRIELEVVNRHGPSRERIDAACSEGALVLWMSIRDLVEEALLDGRSGALVPPDDVLLPRLLKLKFTPVFDDREVSRREFTSRWLDREQVPYIDGLRKKVTRLRRDVERNIGEVRLTEGEYAQPRTRESALENLRQVGTVLGRDFTRVSLAEMEDRIAGFFGMRYDSEGYLCLPWDMTEVNEIIDSYARATVTPPGIQKALDRLNVERGALFKAVDKILDCAEERHRAILAARSVFDTLFASEQERERERRRLDMEAAEIARAEKDRPAVELRDRGTAILARVQTLYSMLLTEFAELEAGLAPVLRIRRLGAGAGQIVLPTNSRQILPADAFARRAAALRSGLESSDVACAARDSNEWLEQFDKLPLDYSTDILRALVGVQRKLIDVQLPSVEEVDQLEKTHLERLEALNAHK